MQSPRCPSLHTGARHSWSCLLLAVSLVSACGHGTSSAQGLRTCVDRWNQANMLGWGPAPVNVAFRRPDAKERSSIGLFSRRQCIVAIPAGGGTWTCVLGGSGAYWCPPLHEPTGRPLTDKNATIDRRGVLELDSPLKGTHPTQPLAWQRYPHVDGLIEPWTSSGKLRPGLRFKGEGRGRCFLVSETARSGISCLTPSVGATTRASRSGRIGEQVNWPRADCSEASASCAGRSRGGDRNRQGPLGTFPHTRPGNDRLGAAPFACPDRTSRIGGRT
jgi:hypothetical protein